MGKASEWIAKVILPILTRMPRRTQSLVLGSLHPTIRLDYPRASLLLSISSPIDIGRARACHKEPETVRWLEEHLRPGDVLYDVGANVGAYSLIAAHVGKGTIQVHSFEPSFATYAQLCRNVIFNNFAGSIHPHLFALNKVTGPNTFQYTSLVGGASLHSIGVPKYSSTVVYEQLVLGFSIDDLVHQFGFPQPTHIKLDVDGIELDILRGAEKTLSSPVLRSVIMEVEEASDENLVKRLLLQNAGLHAVEQASHGGGRFGNIIYSRHSEGQTALPSAVPSN